MSAAREAMLGRIRAANQTAATRPSATSYRRTLDLAPQALVTRFVERVTDYGVTVLRATDAAAVRDAVTARCVTHGVRTLLVPADFPADWRPAAPVPVEDHDLPVSSLEAADAVLATCRLAIAESGTIVLDAGAGQGRRLLTLLPDIFLCVVPASAIVGLMPEAIAAIAPAVAAGAPITFVSGPSATADIELDRVQGVHGPRTLDIVLLGG